MNRDQIIAKLELQIKGLQELVENLKNSKELSIHSIELALFENKLITFFDEVLKIKSGRAKPVQNKIKLDSPADKSTDVNVQKHEDIDVGSIKLEFENLKKHFEKMDRPSAKSSIQFERPSEKSEEEIDNELENLIATATEEFKEKARVEDEVEMELQSNKPIIPKAEEAPQSEVNTEMPKEKIEDNPKHDQSEERKNQQLEESATKASIDESKPTQTGSLNERHRDNQNKTSLLDKLASNKPPTGLSKQMTGKPIKDLKKAINLNLQIRFQRDLFENEKRSYKKAIDFINKCNTYSEARSYIMHELADDYKNFKEGNTTYEEFIGLVKRRFV